MVDTGPHLDSLSERLGTNGSNHELLDVHVGVGVRTAVQDVHHGNGKDVSVGAADVLVERELRLLRCGVSDSQGHTEDGVGTELGLVRSPVELDHGEVNSALLVGLETEDFLTDDIEHVLDGGQDALATVAFAAVTQFDSLEGTRRGTGGDDGATCRSGVEDHLDLNGGIAAGVEDLAGVNELNDCHGACPSLK